MAGLKARRRPCAPRWRHATGGMDAGSRRQRRPGRWPHAPLDPPAGPAVGGTGERHMPTRTALPASRSTVQMSLSDSATRV